MKKLYREVIKSSRYNFDKKSKSLELTGIKEASYSSKKIETQNSTRTDRSFKMKEVQIKKYEDIYHQQFKDISLKWLHAYNLYEKADDALLDNPKRYLDKGGRIFLAHCNNEIVGTVSLIPVSNEEFEIMKLGVVDDYKGLGIGRKLMQLCIAICLEEKVKLITLETSSKLKSAIKMYLKFGFVHVERIASCYESADVKMELKLK
jgi:ribosomal protein S18 acetylase RimI-like enzyme